MNKKLEDEYKKKIQQNTNFFRFVEDNIFSKATPDDIDKLHEVGGKMFPLEDLNKQLLKRGYNEKNMNELIALEMSCKVLWADLFGKDESEYHTKFYVK